MPLFSCLFDVPSFSCLPFDFALQINCAFPDLDSPETVFGTKLVKFGTAFGCLFQIAPSLAEFVPIKFV